MAACCFVVAGTVQGVGFRVAVREQARLLRVSGSAINLDDGRVRVTARGDAAALQALERWLWQGPAGARVEALECLPWPGMVADGFQVG